MFFYFVVVICFWIVWTSLSQRFANFHPLGLFGNDFSPSWQYHQIFQNVDCSSHVKVMKKTSSVDLYIIYIYILVLTIIIVFFIYCFFSVHHILGRSDVGRAGGGGRERVVLAFLLEFQENLL